MLGAGVFALQEAFDITGDELPLHRGSFAFGKLFGRGDPVAAGVLGDVHARIGDTDDVFHRETVYREAPHAEAAADVVLVEHGVGGNPQPQALRQDLRLFYARLR